MVKWLNEDDRRATHLTDLTRLTHLTLFPNLPLHLPKPHDERVQDAERPRDPQAVPEDMTAVLMRRERDLRAGHQIQLLRVVPGGHPNQ